MPSSEQLEVLESSNRFTLDLYGELAWNEPANFFFSPFSIYSALAMTFSGARGRTQKEMARLLHLPAEDETVHQKNADLVRKVFGDIDGYRLSVANRLWSHVGFELRPEFQKLVDHCYGARPKTLDFVHKSESSKQVINGRAEKQTESRIRDLIPPGFLNAMTSMVLTNAIYFKGEWSKKFDEVETRGDLKSLLQWNTALLQPLFEGLPLHVLHNNEVLAIFGLSDLLDIANERMFDGRGRLGFT